MKILISSVILCLLLIVFPIEAQQGRVISGVVTDEQGETLPGATIIIKESQRGTITDFDGNFRLTLNGDDRTLVVSFVGMETQEVVIGNQTRFTISLQPGAETLDEVIVTGYQTISRERATGSYNIISSNQIEKPAVNIGQRIVGTSSGVQTTRSEEHTSELQSRPHLVCRLLLEKKKQK